MFRLYREILKKPTNISNILYVPPVSVLKPKTHTNNLEKYISEDDCDLQAYPKHLLLPPKTMKTIKKHSN
tara:strand:+ start:524 stop:733 length:210 start_codon:yes stop_codon:yes gene_type:complete